MAKDRITAQEVLNSISVPEQFTYDRDQMMMYKLGVLSGWLARLAREDITVCQELRARQHRRRPGDSVDIVRKA
jgi:hypothetical protein